ncbi:uncharacterized protein LAESUDRAFT_268448 [Laetiporus sulphureus 93-53]|uniref:Uncharacterized protein n=1 Tax=Laetiporus sulphureus 93-53 TaxID=1314785 RepID=A0A165H8W4_9APHY|nr:uncharacterized protein LAESUDRAFT_268448 [Laetiporus sulphureus 93-53]KZT11405.1 hypothetical protein LAESUDRAFT_268448 [Laetiporus sulphureus 93-53]
MMISSASVRHRGAESIRSASVLAHLDECIGERGKKEVSKKRVRGVKEGRRTKADAASLNDESGDETSGWSKPSSSPSSSTTSASPSRMGSQLSDCPPDMHMGRGEVLRLAILHSITQGNFVDTEFHLFSRLRQHADGMEVFGPRVAYANSAILRRASPELNSCECY